MKEKDGFKSGNRREPQHKLRMEPDVYYVWCGGSCDYGHEERCSGGAYIMQKNDKVIEKYVISDDHTTEFRMILSVMIHAMTVVPEGSDIVFLTNVSYIQQNFDKEPSAPSPTPCTMQEQSDNNLDNALPDAGRTKANADLIKECVAMKNTHHSVTVKLVPFHKYRFLPDTHAMAHEAMVMHRAEECAQE